MPIRRWRGEATVNTQDIQGGVQVRTLPDGGYIVLWQASSQIYGQRYDALGNAVGERAGYSPFPASSTSADVDVLADGRIYVGSRVSYFGTNLGANLYPTEGGFAQVGAGSSGSSPNPEGGPDVSTGDTATSPLAFAWFSKGQDTSSQYQTLDDTIYLSVYGQDGAVIKTNIVVDQYDFEEDQPNYYANIFAGLDVAVSPLGERIVVAYPTNQRDGPNGTVYGIGFQTYAVASTVTEETFFHLPFNTYSDTEVAGLEWLSPNRLVVLLESRTSSTVDRDLFAAVVDVAANGSATVIRDLFTVSDITIGNQKNPALAVLPDGGFVIAWEEHTPAASDGHGTAIRVKTFTSSGFADGAEFVVNGVSDGDQLAPSVTALEDGRIVVTWTNVLDGVTTIKSQIIDPRDGYIQGTSGPDALYGHDDLDDSISGGDGADLLNGLGGADSLRGGAGDDVYYVDTAADQVIENAGEGTDTVRATSNYTLAANVENGLIATGSNRTMNGNALDNILTGNNGNDILDGKAGADIMRGGKGDDTYYVERAADQVIELPGEGIDTVRATNNYTLAANVENGVIVSASNRTMNGNALDNSLTGNTGNDVLDGKAGADVMRGGKGDDIYYVERAADQVIELAGQGIDTVHASNNYTLAANVENGVIVSASNRTMNGNELDNRLTGNAGDDILDGRAGADIMRGGKGDDTYYVERAADQVIELAGEGIDTVRATNNHTLAANVENGIIASTSNRTMTGNALNNVLTGNAGNDILDGKAGADTMRGGAGDDTYYVDASGDVVVEAANGGAADRVIASVSHVLAANVETLTLTGAAANGIGNASANLMVGTAGNNILKGMAGNDRLAGGAGNDTLDGGVGADRMEGGAGNDIYYVDSGSDVVIEAANAGTDLVYASVTYNAVSTHVERIYLTGTGAASALGNSLDNILMGNGAANQLYGAGGADQLRGGAGADRFVYKAVTDSSYSTYDRIVDLEAIDRIDLSAIDANTKIAGNQAFALVNAFTGAGGQITLTYLAASGFTVLAADVNGDKVADMRIVLNGDHEDFRGFVL